MHHAWLQGVYDDYRRGDPEAVRGVRELQRRVSVGCACERDVAVLKGLDQVHASVGCTFVGQAPQSLDAADVYISDATLQTLLDLIAQARRPPSVNLMTAGTSPLRSVQRRMHGGAGKGVGPMTVAGWYDQGPFFGKGAGGAASRGGATARASAPMTHSSTSHASSFHPGSNHHGTRHHPGGGFASWIGPWGIWPDDCYLDVYGRIWCWGAWGWQVVG